MLISTFANERDTRPLPHDLEWSDLVDLLRTPRFGECHLPGTGQFAAFNCSGKKCRHKFGPAWSPASYPPDALRSKSGVRAVSCLVLDLDDLTQDQFSDAVSTLSAFRSIVHETHTSRPDELCLRVVVALSRPVLASEWPTFWTAATDRLAIPADHAARDASRLFFLPSRPTGADYIFGAGDGETLDVDALLATRRAELRVEPRSSSDPTDYPPMTPDVRQRVLEALRAHGPAIQGKNGDAHTYRACAIVANDWALSEAECLDVLGEWDRTNQPPWGEEISVKLRNAGAYASGPRGHARDLASSFSWALGAPVSSSAGASPDLYGYDVREFLEDDDPGDDQDAWLISGLIPSGVPAAVAGPPKSRKTLMVIFWAIQLAAGRDEFGKEIKRSRVLLICREDGAKEVRRRIWRIARGMGIDPRELSGWLWVDATNPIYLDREEDVKRLDKTMARYFVNPQDPTRPPGAVFIDNLSRVHSADENNRSELAIVTNVWADLCMRHKCVVTMVHHYKKNNAGGGVGQRMRGSGDLFALVRVVVGVESDGKDLSRIEVEGNLPNPSEPYQVTITDGKNDEGKQVIRIARTSVPVESSVMRGAEGTPSVKVATRESVVRAEIFDAFKNAARTQFDSRNKLAYAVKRDRATVFRVIEQLVDEGHLLDAAGKIILVKRPGQV